MKRFSKKVLYILHWFASTSGMSATSNHYKWTTWLSGIFSFPTSLSGTYVIEKLNKWKKTCGPQKFHLRRFHCTTNRLKTPKETFSGLTNYLENCATNKLRRIIDSKTKYFNLRGSQILFVHRWTWERERERQRHEFYLKSVNHSYRSVLVDSFRTIFPPKLEELASTQ